MYAEFMKNLLRPLGVYNLDEGYGTGEIETLGKSFDEAVEALDTVADELIVTTAKDYGLDAYEEILPRKPVYFSLQDRRNAIAAFLLIDGGSHTVAALNQTIAGCGVQAVISETETHNVVRVTFPYVMGVPDNINKLKAIIEGIVPCHLKIDCFYKYNSWDTLAGLFYTWDDMELAADTWLIMETLNLN